jgi:hypothetical protein
MSITAAAWRGLFCAGSSFSFNHTAQSSTQQAPSKLQAVDLHGFFFDRRADFSIPSNTQQANSGPVRQIAPL